MKQRHVTTPAKPITYTVYAAVHLVVHIKAKDFEEACEYGVKTFDQYLHQSWCPLGLAQQASFADFASKTNGKDDIEWHVSEETPERTVKQITY